MTGVQLLNRHPSSSTNATTAVSNGCDAATMRFGQDLHRHMVPEWNDYYVEYNLLKRLVKSAHLSGMILKNGMGWLVCH
jgi:hypothetical protein